MWHEAEWVSKTARTLWRGENSNAAAGNRNPDIRTVAHRSTDRGISTTNSRRDRRTSMKLKLAKGTKILLGILLLSPKLSATIYTWTILGAGVFLLAANSQSTSKSEYRASLWDPWPDFILLFFFVWQLFYSSFKVPSLTRKRVYSLQCYHSLARSLTPNNHTLPSELRLCSLFVGSYD
jgi:hypothetical protein